MVALRVDKEVIEKSWFTDDVFISIVFSEEILWPLYTPWVEFVPDKLSKLVIDAREPIELIAIYLLNKKVMQKSNTY